MKRFSTMMKVNGVMLGATAIDHGSDQSGVMPIGPEPTRSGAGGTNST